MANAASTIEIELEIRDAINRLGRLERELTKSSQSFDRAAQATRKFEGAINKAKAGLVAFFAAISVQKLAQLSDAMTQFENRVKLATNSLVQQIAVQQQLFLVAQKTALPLEDVGQLYSRLRIAAEQLGASQRDLINLTETVGLALKASGTSAASAQGALLQLGQALNSPRVQAEEFNSLIDGMPNLLREVEKQLGLTAGGLKKFVTDGQLSNKKFFDAILASQKALTQQANSSASTIEQANQRVANSFTSLIGAIDDKLGASKFFTGFIDGLASGIDKLSNFLGLTTQATGGGGGGANLDEIISEELEATTPKMPSLYFQTYVEGLAGMMNSNASKTEVKKQIIAFMDYFNQTVGQAVEEGGFSFTPYPDFDPTFKEIIPVKDFIENEYIPILQMLEGMLAQAPNLTFFEEIREELLEQIRLFTVLEENAERTTDAILSGVSGAGPNASRAMNIAQSKSPEEAAAKLILSNEKVAASIEEYFTILFDTIDPLLDILGDLLSAINRLIGALIENATNAAEGILDTVGLGPNGYIFGGGLARDLEAAFSSSRPGGPTNQQKAFAEADSIFENIADTPSTRDQLQPTIDELADLIPDLGLTEVINRITQNTEEAVASLEAVQEINFKTLAAAPPYLMEQIGKEIKAVNDKIAETEEKSKIVIQGLIEAYIQEPLNALNDLTQSAQDQIDAIDFQNMSIQEQIEFRYQESIATIEQHKALADLIDDEDLRTQLLNAANKAEAKTLELKNKQLDQLEREQQLLALQNVETGLQALLSDFERTIEKIDELVQGLFDQVQELLFSDFSPLGPQDQFAQAQSTYESLLENAFDQDATEDDIKALQGFVNEYLTAARNVFKSSTAFTTIFEGVLGDLTGLGLQAGFNMPIQAASTLSSGAEELLGDLPEELQTAVSDMISGLNLATLAFAQQQVEFLTTVHEIPLTIENDLLVVDTSGVNKPISLNASNFSIDSNSLSQIDLSVLMSTSMFTVDTSGLDFKTITPKATPGIPYLGKITPTVDLDASSITDSFDSLGRAVNTAIQDFQKSLVVAEFIVSGDVAGLASVGTALSTSQITPGNVVYYKNEDRGQLDSYEEYSIEDRLATFKSRQGFVPKYAVSGYNTGWNFQELEVTSDLELAERRYQVFLRGKYRDVKKYGFQQGGLVPGPMDTIPAMLSPGEYILSPETVRRYGVSNLNRLNAGDSAAINATSDPEVKRLLAELIVAVRENDTEVNVFTDMQGQTKAGIEEFRSELRERTRRQGDQYIPARYI